MNTANLDQAFINAMREKLKAEKIRLETELAGLPAHLEIGQRDDDNAKEAENDEVNQSIKVKIEIDLAKIEKALAKIAGGTYGVDDEGLTIAKERLKVLPWADKAL